MKDGIFNLNHLEFLCYSIKKRTTGEKRKERKQGKKREGERERVREEERRRIENERKNSGKRDDEKQQQEMNVKTEKSCLHGKPKNLSFFLLFLKKSH